MTPPPIRPDIPRLLPETHYLPNPNPVKVDIPASVSGKSADTTEDGAGSGRMRAAANIPRNPMGRTSPARCLRNTENRKELPYSILQEEFFPS